MADIILHKVNEAFIRVECEKHFAQELSDYFTFFVPNYQFTPAYKNKIWDGKIRLLNLRNHTIYSGLVHYIQKFCKDRKYTLEINSDVTVKINFSLIEAKQFIETLKLPHEVRDYQINSFVHAVRNKKMLLLSPTGSGKSLILYLILRYLQANEYKKGLLIVPTVSLCYQMYKDFEDYSLDDGNFNVEDEVSIVMAGKNKNPTVERIKITFENDNVKYYKPNSKIKTKRGIVLAKNLKDSDEIL